MKLTVSFGGTKVVVPCGDGGMSVRDLIEKALHRYKKSVSRDSTPLSQSLGSHTRVHSVTLARDGGLLDWDDCVRDVLDDRELVIAHVGGPCLGPGVSVGAGGDGTSASGESLLSTASPGSSGVAARLRTVTATAVPGRLGRGPAPPVPSKSALAAAPAAGATVVVTSSDISQGSKLLVRSGSDPRGGGGGGGGHAGSSSTGVRRSSLLGAMNGRRAAAEDEDSDESDDYTKPGPRKAGAPPGAPSSEAFARSAARQSLGNNPALLRWLDAQEHLSTAPDGEDRSDPAGRSSPEASPSSGDATLLVTISNSTEAGRGGEPGLIGVSVKPWYLDEAPVEAHSPGACPLPPSSQRLIRGMEVHYVAEGGRLHRDGRVKTGDRIIEVNDLTLNGLTYARAQEIFRKSSQCSELRLRVLPAATAASPPSSGGGGGAASRAQRPPSAGRPKPPPFSNLAASGTPSDEGSDSGGSRLHSAASSAPPVPKRSPHTQLTAGGPGPTGDAAGEATTTPRAATPKTNSIDRSAANTKKIGTKLSVQLTKEKDGLGFSLTTRDNATNGPNPVYVKNILPHGNAIKDGRLRAGDRVLEVNGADVSRSSQPDVVHLLRSISAGSTVNLVVSRIQDTVNGDATDNTGGISSAKTSADFEAGEDDADMEEVMMELDIPLNETGAAGLGISVKGRSRRQNSEESLDMEHEGVFINSIITGGAASKDGRLRVNDQLLEVNGKSLRGLPNRQAMAILREAMQMRQGPRPGYIRLRMSRRQRKVSAQVHPRQFHGPAENKVSHNPAYQDTSAASTPMDSPQKRAGRVRRMLPVEPKGPPSNGRSGRMSTTPTGSTVSTTMRRFASAEHLDAVYKEETGRTEALSAESDSESSAGRSGEPARDSGRRGRTAFRREGPGRRSMSEKRRAHADARKFEFYEEWRAARLAREANDDRGYHTLPPRLRRGVAVSCDLRAPGAPSRQQRRRTMDECRPAMPPTYASVLSALEDDFAAIYRGHAASASPPDHVTHTRSQLNLSSKTSKEPLLIGNGALPPSLSAFEPGHAVGGSGGMKRAISMESLLSSVRSEAVAASGYSGASGAATTGRPLSRSRPNNNSFRRAVDPSYNGGKGPHHGHGPAPQPPKKVSASGLSGSAAAAASNNNNNNGSGGGGANVANSNSGSFFKNLFRRGANVPAKAAPLPPTPAVPAQPASLPTTPVTSQPTGPFPPVGPRPRGVNNNNTAAAAAAAVAAAAAAAAAAATGTINTTTTATTVVNNNNNNNNSAGTAPQPPPPPPPRANFPQPPGPPTADSALNSVENRVLQWQRQNAAAMAQQQQAAAAAAAAFSSTPKRAPPAPPPVNYELRGPPPMVSASVQQAPPLPPPPNSRMKRHIYEDVGGYEPVGRPSGLSGGKSSGKGPAPAPPRVPNATRAPAAPSGATSAAAAAAGSPTGGAGAPIEASHPVLSHYMVGDNQDIYARVNKL